MKTALKESNSPLLTDVEAAEYLRCSASWLRQLRIRGDGPVFIKLGRSIRYRIVDLDIWVSGNRRNNTLEG